MKEILKIRVVLNEDLAVNGAKQSIRMLGFTGEATGPYFQGKIMPLGVDTQKFGPEMPLELSARYMLEGIDYEGTPCKMFIENNGSEKEGIVFTKPMIVTDSPYLKWLEYAELKGEIEGVDGGVVIHITADEKNEKGCCGFEKEQVWVQGGIEQKKIYGKLYLPEGKEKCPAVILSHGYNGSGDDFVKECEYFASHGIIAFAFDFCGGSVHSRSTGDSKEMSVITEKEDLDMIINYVKEIQRVDKDRIFLLGGSQGGLVSALEAAEKQKEIRGMILYYPALCIPDDWKKRFPVNTQIPESMEFWDMVLGESYVRAAQNLEPYNIIGNYGGPVLIIHGDEDKIVPPSYSAHARDVYENAELVILAGEGHGFTAEGAAAAAKEALRFVRETV